VKKADHDKSFKEISPRSTQAHDTKKPTPTTASESSASGLRAPVYIP
jgi:hypothetical protein